MMINEYVPQQFPDICTELNGVTEVMENVPALRIDLFDATELHLGCQPGNTMILIDVPFALNGGRRCAPLAQISCGESDDALTMEYAAQDDL